MTWFWIAQKDLRVLSRDPMGLFWVLGFPLVFAVFFGSVMKAGVEAEANRVTVIVVTDDEAAGKPLVEGLREAGITVQTSRLPQARAQVRTGEALAYLHVLKTPTPEIELGVDPSRRAEANMLEGLTMRLLTAATLPPGTPLPQVHSTAVALAGPKNGYEIVFPAMILWGLMGCAATFAVSMVSEASTGTLLRLRAAPITRPTILLGKAMACVAACIATASLLALVGHFGLGVRILDPLKFTVAMLATVLCFAGLTMVLSVLGRSEQGVAGAGWSALILFAMLGGAMVPLAVMPEWLLKLSDLSPVKWGISALEGATWRRLAWPDLRPQLLGLAFAGALCFGAGAAVVSLRRL